MHITLINTTQSIKCTFIAKLIDQGFDVNENSDTGEKPLSVAVTAGYIISVAILLFPGYRDLQEHTSPTEWIILNIFFILNIVVTVFFLVLPDSSPSTNMTIIEH